MAKTGYRYLEIEPFGLSEKGFHKERNQVSESLFSLGNEYSGVRGFFEEGVSLPSLIGTYYNGIIEYSLEDTPNAYKGIAKRTHFTINSTNYLKVTIDIDGQKVDLGKEEAIDFYRHLSFKNGLYTRSFKIQRGEKIVSLSFERLVGMTSPHQAIQRIRLSSSDKTHVKLSFHLDGTILHWGEHCYWKRGKELVDDGGYGLYLTTPRTHQSLFTFMLLENEKKPAKVALNEKTVEVCYDFELEKETTFTRFVTNLADKKDDSHFETLRKEAEEECHSLMEKGFDGLLKENEDFFEKAYERSDIEIDGDSANQQGIRFCLFNLLQAYTGIEEDDNIGAKGLTGEAYSGHAFWDSETYCLPFYLFSNQQAAKDLLMFRYHTLDKAISRAKDLDCEGACFPIATRNGEEACTLWQHASTQFQPTTGVGYAIFHYMNLFHDVDFMKCYGLRMLLEITKFLASRGQWNSDHSHFGFYGVMGPDEFEVMVNHNTYTNFMAKKIMQYTLDTLKDPLYHDERLLKECGYTERYIASIQEKIDKMLILYDQKTKLFEQHKGFYDLPHIDVDKIPESDFPLYSHWSYDRIYRNDMIKQPDVLMFLFLYPQDFSKDVLEANYDYYEPRCIHESSLSPSVHSILAVELGKESEALHFFEFATRLDLDDYNHNTSEGLHMTSIAAAWMNIVYGFLGLRSDKETLRVSPFLPKNWSHYSVRLIYHGSRLKFDVYPKKVAIENFDEETTIIYKDRLLFLKKGVTEIS